MENTCCHALILQHKMQMHSNKTHCQSLHQKARELNFCKMLQVRSYFKYIFILFSGFRIKEMSRKPGSAAFSNWPQKMHMRLVRLSSRSQLSTSTRGRKKFSFFPPFSCLLYLDELFRASFSSCVYTLLNMMGPSAQLGGRHNTHTNNKEKQKFTIFNQASSGTETRVSRSYTTYARRENTGKK